MKGFQIFHRHPQGEGPPLRPQQLKAELAQWLPLDPESIAGILDSVKAFNAAVGPGEGYLALLHVYRDRVNGVFEAYETPAFHQRVRGSQHRNRIREDMGRLTAELANGYKIVVTLGHARGRNAHDDGFYRQAMYCAMEQTSLTLLHAFRTYGPVPRKAHQDLHQLYQLAERQRSLYLPVELNGEPAPSENIGRLYKQFLLLAIADPFHLGRGEAMELYRHLHRYTPGAELYGKTDCRADEGLFALDLNQDTPPAACRGAAPAPRPAERRILDVSQVIAAALRDQINEGLSGRHRVLAARGRRLLKQLVPRLKGGIERREPRNPVHWSARVCPGIEALHYHLSEGLDRLPGQMAGAKDFDPARDLRYPLQPWNIVEESVNGYRLSCDQDAETITVGDIVMVLDETRLHTKPEPRLALVRWLRTDEDGRMLMGAEKIAILAVPVRCEALAGDTTGGPCLLLPGAREHNEPAMLLTSAGFYRPGDLLRLTRAGHAFTIRITERAWETTTLDGLRFAAELPASEESQVAE